MPLSKESLDELVTAVARFVKERLVPIENEVAENDKVPDEVIDEMKGMGLFGMSIPEEHGGLGLTVEEEVTVAFELGRTSPVFRSALGTNNGIGSQGIIMFGTDDQKKRYLPGLASGEIIGSFALTEPEAGSDAGSCRTTAKRTPGGYVISGTKRFITNAPKAGVFTVFARTDENVAGAKGLSAFLVPGGLPGIEIGKPDKKMGQHGTYTSDVIFNDVKVEENALLGGVEGQGFKAAMQVLDRGRLHISAVCVGVAERLISDSVRYSNQRKQFGKPISDFQLIQAMLADSYTEALAAKCMVLETARKRDLGKDVNMDAAACKMYASEMVGRVADRAVQIYGGAGYIADYGIERFYRDVRLFRLYEGTTQIQQIVIARGLNRGEGVH
ncbi:MAG TPA: acyl-CoA dehydrogenase family protein [Polyangiaceae bacterium]|jgi:acyl-CoA dehydrogenase|nr:acyl-CoA dehydrogenase family protein [Polyangiaceae bacterium]